MLIPVDPGSHDIKARALDRGGRLLGERVFGDVAVEKGRTRFLVAAFPY